MPDSPDGLVWIPEARLQELCQIKRSTWRSWVDAGLVEEDDGGAYDEGQVLEVALIAALREHLSLQDAILAWRFLRRRDLSEAFVNRARELGDDDRFDLVIEPDARIVRLAYDDASLVSAVRHPEDPRPVLVISLASRLRRIRDGFHVMAERGARPTARKVGRPSKPSATITPLRVGRR